MVLAGTTTVGNVTALMEDEPISATVTLDTKEEPTPTVTSQATTDDDDTIDYFQKLAEDN